MAMFTKETALEVAYIGAGAVAGKVVGAKVYEKLPASVTTQLGTYAPYVEGAIPVLIGLFLPQLAGSSTLVRGLANGMIASGASTIVGTAYDQIKGATAGGGAGVGNVMMGNVMMSGYGNGIISTPLMGSTDGDSDYSDTSYDFTSAGTGEMDY
jgi:hypothetical protein